MCLLITRVYIMYAGEWFASDSQVRAYMYVRDPDVIRISH